jgi:hypothetical protein
MDYQEFIRLSTKAAQLVSSGQFKEAGELWYSIILSDISDIDKAAACLKMASLSDRFGCAEEVLGWYDRAIGYEQSYCRYAAEVEKACYLVEIGRCTQAAAILESLLKQPFVTEAEKDGFRKEIKSYLSRSLGQWK